MSEGRILKRPFGFHGFDNMDCTKREGVTLAQIPGIGRRIVPLVTIERLKFMFTLFIIPGNCIPIGEKANRKIRGEQLHCVLLC